MTANEAREKWLQIAHDNNGVVSFYGFMYGSPKVKIITIDGEIEENDQIIDMQTSEDCISKSGNYFLYVWSFPDSNMYFFEDYGKTWAFCIEDFQYDLEFVNEGPSKIWQSDKKYWKIREN